MRTINTIIMTLLLAGYALPSFAVEKDFTYCYSCTESDKKNRAKSKIGNSNEKQVTIINKSTRQVYTYEVIKIVEPGLNQVIAQPIPTTQQIKDLIADTYAYTDLIKSLAYTPVFSDSLPFRNSANFPQTAHDLVGSNNARFQLMTSLSHHLSSEASNSNTSSFGYQVVSLVNDLIGDGELINVEIEVVFHDGSSVIFKVSDTAIDAVSKDTIIHVSQKPNSMRDRENNLLPDNPSDLLGNIYNFSGGGSSDNILFWRSMINRLTALGYFGAGRCTWTGSHTVVCPYTTPN